MISAEQLLDVLERKEVVAPEALDQLRQIVARSDRPLSGSWAAKWLVDNGHLAHRLAQWLLEQSEKQASKPSLEQVRFPWQRRTGEELPGELLLGMLVREDLLSEADIAALGKQLAQCSEGTSAAQLADQLVAEGLLPRKMVDYLLARLVERFTQFSPFQAGPPQAIRPPAAGPSGYGSERKALASDSRPPGREPGRTAADRRAESPDLAAAAPPCRIPVSGPQVPTSGNTGADSPPACETGDQSTAVDSEARARQFLELVRKKDVLPGQTIDQIEQRWWRQKQAGNTPICAEKLAADLVAGGILPRQLAAYLLRQVGLEGQVVAGASGPGTAENAAGRQEVMEVPAGSKSSSTGDRRPAITRDGARRATEQQRRAEVPLLSQAAKKLLVMLEQRGLIDRETIGRVLARADRAEDCLSVQAVGNLLVAEGVLTSKLLKHLLDRISAGEQQPPPKLDGA